MTINVTTEVSKSGPRSYRARFTRPDGSSWTTPWATAIDYVKGDISDEMKASLRDYPDTEFCFV